MAEIDGRHPQLDCDVIMKGGITSGVVYPKAILQLAKKYRFRSIGGTSAGAIAAAITAAAEYGRSSGGFDQIAKIPEEMQEHLASLFQPEPEAEALYGLVIDGLVERRLGAALGHVVRGQWPYVAGTLAAGLALSLLALASAGWVAFILALVLTLLVTAVVTGLSLLHTAPRLLKRLDYGLCPGTSRPCGKGRPALGEWLALTIERAAGRMQGEAPPPQPLTFGDLAHAPAPEGMTLQPGEETIQLRMVTTNLNMRRPHTLPHLDGNFYWRASEFRRLFPGWVVDWMARTCAPSTRPDPGIGEPLYHFPDPDKLPVVVAARMSLSFPVLISAVPLYRWDYPAGSHKTGTAPLRRLLFSDGGLSSNFPIHFFDALLPRRPTFGVMLDTYVPPGDPAQPDLRVDLPMEAREGIWLAIDPIEGLGQFAWSLLNSAKDWQDRLQSVLPGYRERIVHVYLDDAQGGLNLNMPASTIAALADYGDRAGTLLAGGKPPQDEAPFDFDDHRWRRFLIAFARLEETLERCSEVWGDPDDQASFAHFVRSYYPHPGSYGSTLAWRDDVFNEFDQLMQFVIENRKSLRLHNSARLPRPETDMRITPKS